MPVRYASVRDAQTLAANLTPAHLDCRAYGHNWTAHDATHVKRYRYWAVSQRCARCRTIRHQEMSERGVVSTSWYDYAEGYLADVGRIAGDAKGALRLEAVLRRTFVEGVAPPRSRRRAA